MKLKILTVLLLSIFLTSCSDLKRKPQFTDDYVKVINSKQDKDYKLDFKDKPKEVNEPSLVKTLILAGGIFLISVSFHAKS